MVSILKQQESGRTVRDICREHAIAEGTFYQWKNKYGGMVVSDVKRLKELEEENFRLKRMFAELSLDHSVLKDVISKKGWGPAKQRELTQQIVEEYEIPVSRACKLTKLPRSQYYYQSKKDDTEVIEVLQDLAFKHPSYGFRKLFAYSRRAGNVWNHKKVYRVYKLLKLNRKRKGKRRLPARVKQPLATQKNVNAIWSMDFMSDSIVSGRRFRTFNVMDDCSREALAIEIDTSLSSKRVIRTLERIIDERGKPAVLRSDNGPEFTSKDLEIWCNVKEITLQFIQPGRPMQNGFIERFNRLYREAVLDAYLFFELNDVRKLTNEWIEEYNYKRPHESLGNLTPKEWKEKVLKNPISTVLTVC
ncbi:IS3 family transposase [Sandaracinomonas limnophila]|uniref:IS3 family transposase n=1 Tax=Sandaracinomonas limnophila TaxID=1862386 RepID=UPI0037423DC6